jgi:hypothetical protein
MKVYKLILISPSGCGSCADSALLTQYNQVLKKPTYRPALKVLDEIKSRDLRNDLMVRSFSG